jgi:type II secretory pathway pseudopilin PulG
MSPRRAFRNRSAFTLTQLLVIMALLAFALGVLLASVARVRSAAERAVSQNNLKQIILATIKTADDQNGKMPPGSENVFPGVGFVEGNGYGPCLFHILPNLEQGNLYKSSFTKVGEVNMYVSWTLDAAVKTYTLPGDPSGEPARDRTNYAANGLAIPPMGAKYPTFYTDGTSQTIFYAECYSQVTDSIPGGGKGSTWNVTRRWWDNPVWTPVPGPLMFQPTPRGDTARANLPQGFLPNGIQVGLGDGSVRFVADTITTTTFYAACTPNTGDVLGADW